MEIQGRIIDLWVFYPIKWSTAILVCAASTVCTCTRMSFMHLSTARVEKLRTVHI